MKYRILYDLYARRVVREIDQSNLPKHVAIILDGNRRWAKMEGAPAEHGHRKGADKIAEVLGWCQEAGVRVVTLWMLSVDNLRRSAKELDALEKIIVSVVRSLAKTGLYRIKIIGNLELLPESFASSLRAVDNTGKPEAMVINVAVGYGGREEIIDAVKALLAAKAREGLSLQEVAESIKPQDITANLYTKGQPDPDLVIRTSGEQRLSGFLMWQSAHSEFYFCETYWPDFRRIDFLRALRDYGQRERRMGK